MNLKTQKNQMPKPNLIDKFVQSRVDKKAIVARPAVRISTQQPSNPDDPDYDFEVERENRQLWDPDIDLMERNREGVSGSV